MGVWVCLQSGDLSNRIAVLELQSKDLSNRIAVLEVQSEDLSNRIAVLELESEDLSNRIAVLASQGGLAEGARAESVRIKSGGSVREVATIHHPSHVSSGARK